MVSVRARPNNGLSPDSLDTPGHEPGQPGHETRPSANCLRRVA